MRGVPDAPAPEATSDVDPLAEHRRRLAVDGYTVLEGVVAPDLVAGLTEAIDRLVHDLGIVPARNGFEGRSTHRAYNLLAHDRIFEQVPVHPAVLPVVEGVLDAGCLVSSLSSIDIGPGEVAQPIHADDQIIPLPKPHVPTVCNSMWALTEFTEANGATRIIPGSHLADASPDFGSPYDSIPAEMAAGSVLVWHGSLWHGGGANTTGERRVGLAMNYCAGWIRQQENQQLGIPTDVARRFSPRLRELCGYGVYSGLIGHIDRADPAARILGPVPGEGDDPGGADADDDGNMVWDRA